MLRVSGVDGADVGGGVHVAAEVDAQDAPVPAPGPQEILVAIPIEVAGRRRGGGLCPGSRCAGERRQPGQIGRVRVAQRGEDGLRLLNAERDEEAEIERRDALEGTARLPEFIEARLVGRGDLEGRPEVGELADRRRGVALQEGIFGGLERRARPGSEVRGDLAQTLHGAQGGVEFAARELRIGERGERGQVARRGRRQARQHVRPGVRVRAGRPGLELHQPPQAARVARVRRQRLVQQRPRLPEVARLRAQHGQGKGEFRVVRRPLPRLEQVLPGRLVVRRLERREPEPRVPRRFLRRHLDEALILCSCIFEAILLECCVPRPARRENVRQRCLGDGRSRLSTGGHEPKECDRSERPCGDATPASSGSQAFLSQRSLPSCAEATATAAVS